MNAFISLKVPACFFTPKTPACVVTGRGFWNRHYRKFPSPPGLSHNGIGSQTGKIYFPLYLTDTGHPNQTFL